MEYENSIQFLLEPTQTGPGTHPSYQMGAGGSFAGVKRPGREADHSPPSQKCDCCESLQISNDVAHVPGM